MESCLSFTPSTLNSSSSSLHRSRRSEYGVCIGPLRLSLASHGLPIGSFSLTQPIKRPSIKYNLLQRAICCSRARQHFYQEPELSRGLQKGLKCHKQKRLARDVAVRSEIASSGIPEASYPLSELWSNPKVRGICFYVVTAISAIILIVPMLLEHPFVLLFDRYRRKAHYLIARTWASLTVTPFVKIDYEGLDNLPSSDTPAVYVSNHQSFLDIYTLLTLGRSFKFISKTAIFLYPIIGWAMFLLGVIPIKRMDSRSQLECFRQCMALINKGASVFFFPEGTRNKDGILGPFKKGAFSVAAKTRVPVIPITLVGTGEIMPSGKEGTLSVGSIKVVVHPSIKGDDAETLCNQARNIIADELGQTSSNTSRLVESNDEHR